MARSVVAGGASAVALILLPPAAHAAEPPAGHDAVSNFRVAAECDTGDQIRPILTFHLEAGADTPETGRVVRGVGFQASPAELDDPYEFDIIRDQAWFDAAGREFTWGELYFPLDNYESGDFEINLDYSAGRSTIENDHFGATLYYADGVVAASDEITINCFNENGETQLSDIDVTVRAGVPATVRFRQYMLLSGVDGDGDTPRQVWVASPGLAWDADNHDQDTLDDLALDPDASTALGAALADQILKLNATAAGDFALEWGAVTTPLGDEWTGGYGDRWGPAALRIHVIDGPVMPSDSAITDSSRGVVSAPTTVQAGSTAAVSLGASEAGEYVDVWLHSDPVYLGLMQVPADGVLRVTLPDSAAAGDHRLIVTDAIGTLIGWDEVSVTGTGSTDADDAGSTDADDTGTNQVPRGATGLDEDPARSLLPLAMSLLAVGGAGVVGLWQVTRSQRRRAR